jgi:phosphatidylserine/phosphatidylglycerophosphate/cardiolipin synthase-like enzyme
MSGVTPQDWFLTSSESRMQPAYTNGNTVHALVDGQAYMEKLSDSLQSLRSDGRLYISAWRITPQLRLLADQPTFPTIRDILSERVNAGNTIRSLFWYVPGSIGDFGVGHGDENLEIAQLLEHLGAEVVLDDRLPSGTFASHHQKFIVLEDSNRQMAFIGGIDLALDRWDHPQHDEPAGRQRELFDGWHDVQAQIEGPAVAQLWDSFVERWNDSRRPNGAPFTAGNSTPNPISLSARPSPIAAGTMHVQVLLTYPCQSRDHSLQDQDVFPFAPHGDYSYEAALIKAIEAAEHFIYLEDQYFWPCRVVDALATAVARGVTVILLLTNKYDVPGLGPYHNYMRQSSIDQLKVGDPNRVFVYHLAQSGLGNHDIYVHAKTMIVDDRYVVIGSANINQRSMRTDTEIGVAILDSDIVTGPIHGQSLQLCRFARDYRKQLWQEHLGTEIDDPLKSNGSPHGWPEAIGQQIGHAVVHQVPMPQFCRLSLIPFTFMNPETTCQ